MVTEGEDGPSPSMLLHITNSSMQVRHFPPI